MDHTPYGNQKQHQQSWNSLSQTPTNNDTTTNDAMMTGWFSGSRRLYSGEPTKIGVSYRTRRRRHYDSPGADSDVSVITFNSGTTFGRFSQNLPQSPRVLSPYQNTQLTDFQDNDSLDNQQASQFSDAQSFYAPLIQGEDQLSDAQEVTLPFDQQENRLSDIQPSILPSQQRITQPNFSRFAPRIQPSPQNRETNAEIDANNLTSRPTWGDHHVDTEENDITENWSTVDDWTSVNNGNSSGRIQQQQQRQQLKQPKREKQAPYVNHEGTNNRHSKYLGDGRLGPQQQVSAKTVEVTIDSEEDEEYTADTADDQHLATYKLLSHLKDDDEVTKTLLWSESKHIERIQTTAPITKYIDEQQREDKATSVLSQKLLGKRRLFDVEMKQNALSMDRPTSPLGSKPATSLSEQALGKKRIIEPEEDALSINKVPLPDSNAKERSPSVLSLHYDDYQDDHDDEPPSTAPEHRPATIEQKMKQPAQESPGTDYGADEADMNYYAEEEQSERPRSDIPRINTDANLARKLIDGYKAQHKMRTSIPMNVTKSLFESALPLGTSLAAGSENMAALTEATNLYFEQLRDDLEAYATHSGNITIDRKTVELLMTRQRLVTESTSLESLAYEYLPRELWDDLCVSALAQNVLYPRRR